MTRASLVAALVLCAATASAQSNLRNARLESRPGTDLAGTFQTLSNTAGPIWIAYAVPAQDPEWNACCYENGRQGRCRLEEGRSSGTPATGSDPRGPIHLEAGSQVMVLYRVESQAVGRIRAFSDSCELDADGASVHWLTGVTTPASLELLQRLASRPVADGERRDRVVDGALLAISAHRDAAADRILAAFMAADQPMGTRKQAAFWAANARGRAGFELTRAALLDTSNAESFRKHLTFVVSQSRDAEAVDTLTRVAKQDASATVRGEAIFWLAQKAGQKAARAITDAIANDPETKVKEKAVFALSQLPKDEGVPKLIEVARDNRNPAVRKQAMFWLGQSRDPRALAFFEQVLARP